MFVAVRSTVAVRITRGYIPGKRTADCGEGTVDVIKVSNLRAEEDGNAQHIRRVRQASCRT